MSIFPATRYLVERGIFTEDPFKLIDVGCRGGIHDRWRTFGNDLTAYAVDPLLSEIERLKRAEQNPNVKYWAGFVGLSEDHPLVLSRGEKGPFGNLTWKRLSTAWAARILAKDSDDENTKLARNEWTEASLAERTNRLGLSEFVTKHQMDPVDFVKIDVDGEDLYLLYSGEDLIRSQQVLGFDLEVNFFGTDCATDNTFHNTDRFMRSHGYELFDLQIRRYSRSAMPAPFAVDWAANTEWGAPLQGDVLYVRDVVREKERGGVELTSIRLLKLVALHEMFGLPDCAAEILLTFEESIAELLDITPVLNLLTPEFCSKRTTYDEYRQAFATDPSAFYAKTQEEMYPRPTSLRSRLGRIKRSLWSHF